MPAQALELIAVPGKVLIEADSPVGIGIKFDHPSVDAVGLELVIPGSVEGVSERDTAPVTPRPSGGPVPQRYI